MLFSGPTRKTACWLTRYPMQDLEIQNGKPLTVRDWQRAAKFWPECGAQQQ